MRSKDRAPFYFAVLCLLFSLRMLLVGERFLLSRLELDFSVYRRMAYLCVFNGFSALGISFINDFIYQITLTNTLSLNDWDLSIFADHLCKRIDLQSRPTPI